jgi:hypothetical protein
MLKVAGGGLGSIAVRYQGTWDAATNTPTLTSGVGQQGDYYVVSVAGNTNLDGITDWEPGDWAIFNGAVWQKVDNTDQLGVTNVATGTGLTGGPITSTGTISIANTGVTAATYGSANAVAQVVINAQGQVTNATDVPIAISVANVANAVSDSREIIAGTGLTGGGNLSANVTISMGNTNVVAATYGGGSNAAEVTVDPQGRITAAANVAIPQGTVTNIQTGTGLSGGPITGSGTISLANTSVTAGVYGDAATVAQVTINAQGQATNVANVPIAISVANVANAVPDSRVIIAGTGLSGGGNLASNVTISMSNTNVTIGTYGGGTNAAEITVDQQGRITSAANVAIPQGTVTNISTGTGLTGGPITGTGTIAIANTGVSAGVYGDAATVPQVTINAQGQATNITNVGISIAVANVANAVPDTRVITAGTGLTGGGNLASNVTISLANTNVSAGVYGSNTQVAQITVDAQGRITAASNISITGGGSGNGTVITNILTITAGSNASWINNTSAVITWENNSLATIDWTHDTFNANTSVATILVNCSAGILNVKLPTAATNPGQAITVKKIDSTVNAATINTTSSQTIDGSLSYPLPSQWNSATVQSDGANWFVTAEVV